MAEVRTPLDEPQFEGRKVVPRLVGGCLAFGILMSLLSYGIWMGTKDYFIEKARSEGQDFSPEEGKRLAPEPKQGNGMFSP
jgi:hypothetical protein